eukprot:4121332-Amphidinium_carterae.1
MEPCPTHGGPTRPTCWNQLHLATTFAHLGTYGVDPVHSGTHCAAELGTPRAGLSRKGSGLRYPIQAGSSVSLGVAAEEKERVVNLKQQMKIFILPFIFAQRMLMDLFNLLGWVRLTRSAD